VPPSARSSHSSVQWWNHPKSAASAVAARRRFQPSLPGGTGSDAWTVDRDIDLGNWLLGFGAGIRIDSPPALRQEHRQKLAGVLVVYSPP
jgi:hypothetical protein